MGRSDRPFVFKIHSCNHRKGPRSICRFDCSPNHIGRRRLTNKYRRQDGLRQTREAARSDT